MEAPDELFEYEAELVDERLEEEDEMDEQLKNQSSRCCGGDSVISWILKKSWSKWRISTPGLKKRKDGYLPTTRVSTEKAVDALLQEGQRVGFKQNRMMHYFTFRIVHILQEY